MTSSAVLVYRHPEIADAEVAKPPATSGSASPSSDSPGHDDLGRGRLASRLAALLSHSRTETPTTVALFGPPGSGKSRVLRRVADLVASGTARSPDAASAAPSVPVVVSAPIDLAGRTDVGAALAHGLLDALAPDHADFAEEALHAGGNPRDAAKRAGERAVALRRALDGERKILDDFGARRARLVETVLFETAGTRVDGYARANRARIEARLRIFGLPTGDPLRTYKDLVRETSETSGGVSRIGLVLRSLWGFKGQGFLIVVAVLLFAVGWFADAGVDDEARLSGWLAGLGDRFAFLTDWERAHLDWLHPIGQAAWVLGALALAAAVLRAVRFAGPILKGATLLKADLGERRRDIDGLIAQQTRRIDGLVSEAEAAARNAEQAERRLGGQGRGGLSEHGVAMAGDLFGNTRSPGAAAEAFCAALSRRMTEAGAAPGDAGPGRIAVVIDGLDHMPAAAAADALETAHRLLARPGFSTIVALDRHRILDALGPTDPALAAARLDRVVQLSYDLGADAPDPAHLAGLLIETRPPERPADEPDAVPAASDRVLEPFETAMIRGLAPFAGTTPRAVKRFVDAYRFARTDPGVEGASRAVLGCLAWAIAVDGTPAGADLARFEADAAGGRVHLDKASDLGRAFSAVHEAVGGEFTASEARQAMHVSRRYGRGGRFD